MERMIWTRQSTQPFYVFDEKHIVHFWDDGVSIHGAASCYKDAGTRLSPFDGPHIYPKALPLEFYKSAVLDARLPLSVVLEGDNLGTVKRTAGYAHGESEIGAHRRRIIRQQTKLSNAGGSFIISIRIETTPVDPTTVSGDLQDEDKSGQSYEFEFAFPSDLIPELLNLTETERRTLEQGNQSPA